MISSSAAITFLSLRGIPGSSSAMPADYDDEYVASLLTQDAKDATKKYELVGIDAFNPKKRCVPLRHTGDPDDTT